MSEREKGTNSDSAQNLKVHDLIWVCGIRMRIVSIKFKPANVLNFPEVIIEAVKVS